VTLLTGDDMHWHLSRRPPQEVDTHTNDVKIGKDRGYIVLCVSLRILNWNSGKHRDDLEPGNYESADIQVQD